jgi:hypothetical protein
LVEAEEEEALLIEQQAEEELVDSDALNLYLLLLVKSFP